MPTTRGTSKDGGRYYTDSDGQRYFSVTTIINGGIPKPALMPWAQKAVGEEAIRVMGPVLAECQKALGAITESWLTLGTPVAWTTKISEEARSHVEATLQRFTSDNLLAGIVSDVPKEREKARKYLSATPNRVRDKAAVLGQSIHRAIEAYILEQPMPMFAPDVQPFMTQFNNFLEEHTPEFEVSEAVVYNTTKQYAGTLDFTAHLPKVGEGLYIGDVKSGNRVYPEVGLQLAAYRAAEFLETKAGRFEMPEITGGVTLHLRPNYFKLLPIECGNEQFRVFEYAREIYRFVSEGHKEVIGEAIE